MGIRIAIDRGGTFTDCVGNPGTGEIKDDVIIKLLSVDPLNYPDAPLEGIRRLLEIFLKKKIPRGQQLGTSKIEYIRMGTTVATNALLERRGSEGERLRCALVTTKGFKDCLIIGNQTRPNIFDLSAKRPDVLYESVVEIDERVTLEDYSEDSLGFKTDINLLNSNDSKNLVQGISGEAVRILKKPVELEVRSTLKLLYSTGIKSIAICLLHSFTFSDHEKLVAKIAKEIGFSHISTSSELSPMIKFVPRANSSVADAYLTPEIQKYLNGFESGLSNGIKSLSTDLNNSNLKGVSCEFMQSDGGLADAKQFSGLRAILSGPAGGVVGYSQTCYDSKNNIPLIGFDMGGTSTDVSRYGDGKFDHVFETVTAGVTIQSPQLDINTVAAGGGSRLFYKNGLFVVGPESAGSHPGPTSYRKGGPLTITDANLFLGRLLPEYFPSIFGPDENQSLDEKSVRTKFFLLTKEINKDNPQKQMTPEQVAFGFITVANETMSRPIRALTEAKGHIVQNHRLVSFGGAGGQHAVAIAKSLGITVVLVHRYSSVLSAYGMALADVVEEIQAPSSIVFSDDSRAIIEEKFNELKTKSRTKLLNHGFAESNIRFEQYLNIRYSGTDTAIMVPRGFKGGDWDFLESFNELHKREFGFIFEHKDIIVDDIRVRGIGSNSAVSDSSVDDQLDQLKKNDLIKVVSKHHIKFLKEVFFAEGKIMTPIYRLEELEIGTKLVGPCILADGTQTNVIEPGCEAILLKAHIFIKVENKSKNEINNIYAIDEEVKIDPILLSIFGHRFMDIAEQMGTSLQKTSVSTNVKERLDFSCALFDSNGNLVANAPHLPVHLGSMSKCVSSQAKLWKDKLSEGDVIVSNHPAVGGTHLPDITVITPKFHNEQIIFYVASRAHHADIGGILPGSMPPNSKQLYEEGAAIYSELLVTKGKFEEEKMIDLLLKKPSEFPGCSGTRCINDNLSDLRAQIAANQKGIELIQLLISEFGLKTIMSYMVAIQENSAKAVSNMLKIISKKFLGHEISAEEYMDDGSRISLKVDISSDKTIFDFSGTSQQVYNNINAPEAITYSAIIYCLRCLVAENIPLNQGCLKPIEIIIPKDSLLSPSVDAAVVGGNVMTSQRVTDVVLKAFNIMSGSQGDCNNLTFGTGGNDPKTGLYTPGFGYYETIAGGHGAASSWDGVDGVHTNMTNTRITDAEIFERRYPIILREFSLRKGSGGQGRRKGGDGVIRDIEFRIPVTCSILSERRVMAPYALEKGEPGARGINLWIKTIKDKAGKTISKKEINIGGKNTINADVGDHIIILTPGGGGFGKKDDSFSQNFNKSKNLKLERFGNGSMGNRLRIQETN
ncbi:5-oxoprolinase [Ascoidea rubescens DSM 1968]|uniref:5-oxoprolinase n=1 Tax=Ascoidea rubescens DSM 1968 TaxID=1344418 RepID=A0A1D2VDI8_9ASCO|nr:5-oxoprolinase [Ascoidea rubescens DSM 1968]ODV59527.1 5-oxoprolinase [Ascoidea rubescens DSM 1968]